MPRILEAEATSYEQRVQEIADGIRNGNEFTTETADALWTAVLNQLTGSSDALISWMIRQR